jgi:hypothetical protein
VSTPNTWRIGLARNDFQKPVDKIIDLFSDERLTQADMAWLPQLVILNAHPSSIVDKIELFCKNFLAQRNGMG